ncbi:MAG: hypothetical protein JNM93_01235 [Bacteriovoracaceae bacterium]|nr:hypothetical protein [Bacteriovoracaceae bacterium]
MYGLPVGLSKLPPELMFKLIKAFELINIVSLLSLILLFVQTEPRKVHRRISMRLPLIAGLWAWYSGTEAFLISRVLLVFAPVAIFYFFRKNYQLSFRASLYFSFFALADMAFYHLGQILVSEILFGVSMIFYFKLINQILIKTILDNRLEEEAL